MSEQCEYQRDEQAILVERALVLSKRNPYKVYDADGNEGNVELVTSKNIVEDCLEIRIRLIFPAYQRILTRKLSSFVFGMLPFFDPMAIALWIAGEVVKTIQCAGLESDHWNFLESLIGAYFFTGHLQSLGFWAPLANPSTNS